LKSISARSKSTKASRTEIEALPLSQEATYDLRLESSDEQTKFSNSLIVMYPLLSLSYSFISL